MRIADKFRVIFFTLTLFVVAVPQTEVRKTLTNKIQTTSLTDDLTGQAEVYAGQWSGASVRRSIALYDELFEKYHSDRDLLKAEKTLIESARLLLLLERYDDAESKLNEALKINRQANNKNTKAEILSLLSVTSLRNGKLPESDSLMNQALEINAPDATAKASVYSAAAELNYVRREIKDSIENCQMAIDLWRESGNIREEVRMLRLLSYAYIADDDLQNSFETLETAAGKSRQNNLKREEALSQYQTGLYYLTINEPQKALEICRRAETLFPDDMDFVEKARLSNGIGAIYGLYGDWQTAAIYREKAYELFEKGNYQMGKLATISSLVELNFLLNNESAAFDYFRQVEVLSANLRDTFYLANATSDLAAHYNRTGEDEKAIELYNKSLVKLKEAKYYQGVALIENNLGKIHARRKNFELAEDYFQTALNQSRKVRNEFVKSETLFNLAKLRAEQNSETEAIKFAAESVEITENLSAGVVNAKLKTTYFSNVYQRYELYVELLMKLNDKFPEENYAVKALQISEKARARRMLEYLTLSESDFIKDAPKKLVEKEKEILNLLNLKTDKLSDLLNRDGEKSKIKETETEIFQLENELEETRAQLKQSSPFYTAVKNPAPFEMAEFQNQILDENTVLLEFSFGDKASYLWKIGKNDFAAYTLPPREQIETKLRNLRELLAENELRENETIENYQARIAVAEKNYNRTANDLSRELFGNAADDFAGKRLVIVADGNLHYFPVSALPLPNSAENKPILLTNEVVYQPSASLLMMLRQNGIKKTNAGKDLLVFADPVFSFDDVRLSKNVENSVSKTSSGLTESGNSLPRLVASKDEGNSILKIVGTNDADELSGFDASREKFLTTNISDYKILHFATHGLINGERPEISGIVLSRFDENRNRIKGTIRLQDIYALNLESDLVVLSACDTGIGKNIKGESLMSLNNAFLQSGSKAVVSSLWKVDDLATLELMRNFYREMSGENVSSSAALRLAQIKMWENPQYKSPFYWAAFTFHGDFQTKPEFSNSDGYKKFYILLSAFLALALILLGGYRLYKRRRLSIN